MKNKLLGITLAANAFFAHAVFGYAAAPTQTVEITVNSPPQFRVTNLGKLISSTFAFLLVVAGLLAFAYLIIGGIQWITSGGDKAGLEAARNKIVHAIVGLIVVFAAWAITILLQQFLGFSILGTLSIPSAAD